MTEERLRKRGSELDPNKKQNGKTNAKKYQNTDHDKF